MRFEQFNYLEYLIENLKDFKSYVKEFGCSDNKYEQHKTMNDLSEAIDKLIDSHKHEEIPFNVYRDRESMTEEDFQKYIDKLTFKLREKNIDELL